MNKVLITGANGFLGSNLTRELYRTGYEVKIMVRPSADLKGISDIPCEIFYGHIDNRDDVDNAVKGCQVVIHTACITGQWAISFADYERINYLGTKNVTEACIREGVRKLIYVSTANTIGPGVKQQPGTELNGFSLFPANSGYINSKYLAQQHVLEQVAQCRLPAVIVNPTFMIGPNDVKPSSGQLLLHGVKKKWLWCPPGGKNFVHIQDVCRGIINAIDKGRVGDCYLLAGENMSYREFFALLKKITGDKKILVGMPAFVIRTAGMIGSAWQRMTGRPQKLNYSTAYMLCLDNYYTGRKSERELQIRYTPIEDALRHALIWFKENNYF